MGTVAKFEQVLSPSDFELAQLHEAAKRVGQNWTADRIRARQGVGFYKASDGDRFLIVAVLFVEDDLFIWLLGGTPQVGAARDLATPLALGLEAVAKANECVRIRTITRKGVALEMIKRGFKIRNYEVVKEL